MTENPHGHSTTPLKTISPSALSNIIEEHQRWLDTNGEQGRRADLSQTDLSHQNFDRRSLKRAAFAGANLDRASFVDADLSEGNLSGASLRDADLRGINLSGTSAEGADFSGCKLETPEGKPPSNFSGANLRNARFERSAMHRANLCKADLSRALMMQAYLTATEATGANLLGATLSGAEMSGANFGGADLRETKLSGVTATRTSFKEADLRSACLQKARLEEAELSGANLRGADLTQASLNNANLTDAALRDSILRDADLSKVNGLTRGQLGASDTSGAALPEAIKEFQGLKYVEDASQSGRRLLAAILLGCSYASLTSMGTTHVQLFSGSSYPTLPLLGTQVPTGLFFFLAPLILLIVFFYLHISLQRLWETIAELPAYFPDGSSLDKKVYPWLVSGIVQTCFSLLSINRPPLSRWQILVSTAILYWVVPLTLLILWAKYLVRHEWSVTASQVAFLLVAIPATTYFQHLARSTLRGEKWTRGRHCRTAAVWFWLILLVCGGLSYGVIQGFWISPSQAKRLDVRTWVPMVLENAGFPVRAYLWDADLSIRPPGWQGRDEDVPLIKGARLQGVNLRYGEMARVFMVNADLSKADLTKANLRNSDLRNINLSWATVNETDLVRAKLGKANLSNATARGSDFSDADLREADLRCAKLQGAMFQRASLLGAKLQGTDLSRSIGLSAEQVKSAEIDGLTKLPDLLQGQLPTAGAPAPSASNRVLCNPD